MEISRRDMKSDRSQSSSLSLHSHEQSEFTFREKYAVLKSAYEHRIAMLAETLEKTCECLLTDEIVVSMTSDHASSIFVPSLLRDIIQNSIQCDRENSLIHIMEQNIRLQKDLNSKNDECGAARDTINQLQSDHDLLADLAAKDKLNFERSQENLIAQIETLTEELSVRLEYTSYYH